MSLDGRIEKAISLATGQTAKISHSRMASGGSINISRIVSFEDGRTFFVKNHKGEGDFPGMFEAEYEGLELLTAPGVICVPRPVSWGNDFIVIEAYEEGPRKPDWQELMGQQLALMHRKTQRDRYGFHRDNYLGTSLQPNQWMDNWLDFWREQRLGWQLDLFAQRAEGDEPLLAMGERLQHRLDDLLAGVTEAAVLLHGDLWSGNASANENGNPVIFDPACYYGHREAEIGMMRMFGGFGPRCEAAYAEVWPLESGSEERIALYRLYHELNHLNLFGASYYQNCLSTMKALL